MHRWADGDYVPRPEATALAGRAVAALDLGLGFAAVAVDGGLVGLVGLEGPDGDRRVEAAGLMAEARARETRVARLLPAGMAADDPALAWARGFINGPKVWSAMNAVAGALQARRRLARAEVAEIVAWVSVAV
ncbi:MAG: hypothetical protein H6907_16680 [Hyphomicrobiales bacterium]|nr:hypothetical protein [Hyphomicrobiales bacterium]MCP5373364.1 hypothetical protein [Hyphomicrobiales bacterium]